MFLNKTKRVVGLEYCSFFQKYNPFIASFVLTKITLNYRLQSSTSHKNGNPFECLLYTYLWFISSTNTCKIPVTTNKTI